jgi:hypothetical protein
VRRYAELGVMILTDRGAQGLESEFGLLRGSLEKTAPGSATLLQRGAQKQPLGLASADLCAAEAGLRTEIPKVTGRPALPPARAMGTSESGSPVVLVHSFSNQRWIFLNLDFSKYVEHRLVPDATFQFPGMNSAEYEQRMGKPSGGEVLRVLLGEMLEEAAGRPEVQVKSAVGTALRKTWSECKYERGARIFQVEAVGKEPVPVKLTHPLSLYWYDPISAKLIGRGTEISTELKPNTPAVFNALPYPVTAIKGKIRRLDGGGLLRVTVGIAREDNAPEPMPWVEHELELSLRGPGGYELPQYLEKVKTVNGVWDGQFKLALNDPVGDYRLCVKELYTGAKTEIVVTKFESWYSEQFPVKMAPLKDKP